MPPEEAAEAVEAPATAEAPAGDDFAGIVERAEAKAAEAEGEEAPAKPAAAKSEGEAAKPGESEEGEPAKLPPPQEFKPKNMRERLAAKRAAEAEREKYAPLEQQLMSERQRVSEIQAEQQRIQQQAQVALNEGKVDDALKLFGMGSFEEVQKRFLEAKGAIPKTDPAAAKAIEELNEFKRQQAEREQSEQQRLQEYQQQQEVEAFHEEIRDELKGHRIEELGGLVEVGGFVEQMAAQLAEDPTMPIEQAAANTMPQYKAFLEQLLPMAGLLGVELSQPAAAPVKPSRVPTSLKQADAAEVGANPADYDPEDVSSWARKFANA